MRVEDLHRLIQPGHGINLAAGQRPFSQVAVEECGSAGSEGGCRTCGFDAVDQGAHQFIGRRRVPDEVEVDHCCDADPVGRRRMLEDDVAGVDVTMDYLLGQVGEIVKQGGRERSGTPELHPQRLPYLGVRAGVMLVGGVSGPEWCGRIGGESQAGRLTGWREAGQCVMEAAERVSQLCAGRAIRDGEPVADALSMPDQLEIPLAEKGKGLSGVIVQETRSQASMRGVIVNGRGEPGLRRSDAGRQTAKHQVRAWLADQPGGGAFSSGKLPDGRDGG